MRKIILSLFAFLFLYVSQAHATVWYLCSGGSNINGTGFTSIIGDIVGCIGATGTPANGDSIIMNSSSGNLTMNTNGPTSLASITMTGWTGTITSASPQNLPVSGGTVTLATGNTLASNVTLVINGAETLTSGNQTWPGAVTVNSTSAVTLLTNNWTTTGITTYAAAGNINKTGSETYTGNGGVTLSASSGTTQTAVMTLVGGTFSTFTFTTTALLTYSGATTSTSGTLSVSGGLTLAGTPTGTYPTLLIAGSETITWAGFTWPGNVSQGNGTFTITQVGNGTITGTFSNFSGATGGATTTFSGAFNLSVGILNLNSANNARIFTFPASQTLTITTGITINYGMTVKSGTASTAFTITYTGTRANQNIQAVTFTDVTATAGDTLYDYNGGSNAGVLTRTTNITQGDASSLFNGTNVFGS